MPIRTIDPGSALLVIDFQEGTRRFAGSAGPAAYAAAAELATLFRALARPVFLVRMQGGPTPRTDVAPEGSHFVFPPEAQVFVPEIGAHPSDIIITKGAWGAFSDTDLRQQLRDADISHVVLCGTAASVGVESTARQAYEAGFNVTVAVDAVTDFNADALTNSVQRIFPMLGETGTVAEIVAAVGALSRSRDTL